ncbi:MAG TPA: hypothetical protein DEF61_04810 [Firmicutes bacterium]|nr:hypothetical protein [Bacillota bacterium]HBX25548.1 hypothetical protein [Bacillota bacterium]
MKKNDFAIFLVYVAMFAIALLVGMLWIRPIVSEYGNSMALNPILLVFISIVAGILLNSALLELGHILGAKTGRYNIISWSILGLGVKTNPNKKKKFGYVKFDGLTGETKISPKDPNKSSLGGYISFPILFYLIELIAFVIAFSFAARDASLSWLQIFSLVILTVGGMIFVYDYFPARLDSITDGYLMFVVSKPINKVAYNNMLLAEKAATLNEPIPTMPIYDEITDFTYLLNNVTVYSYIEKGEIDKSIKLLDKAINTEKGLSKSLVREAATLKLSLLLTFRFEEGKKTYEGIDDEEKKYISSLSSSSSLRCYLLISGLIEESETETNYAIDKVEKVYKGVSKSSKQIEKSLIETSVALIKQKHPSWNLYELPWQNESKEENK